MIIDVHSHHFPVDFLGRVEALGGHLPQLSAAPFASQELAARLELMDRAGVDMAVISVGALQPYFAPRLTAADLTRWVNDTYVETCLDSDGRLAAFATLPLPDVDLALAELERVGGEDAVLGVTLGTSVAGRELDSPDLEPLYAALDERAAVVFIHPSMAYNGFGPHDYGMKRTIGGMFEDTVCGIRLLMSGICVRYPRIRFIVPHLGGTLPFLYGRLSRHLARLEEQWRRDGLAVPDGQQRSGLGRLWYDTAMRHAPALRCAWETVGHRQLLFGTDYPYIKTEAELADRIGHIRALPIAPGEQDAVLGGTAQGLLGLDFNLRAKGAE